MKKTASFHLLLLLLISLLVSGSGMSVSGSADLDQIARDYWNNILEDSIYFRIKLGLPIDRLPNITEKESRKNAAFASSLLDRLDRIDASQLSHEDFISREILKWECAAAVEGSAYFWLNSPVTPYSSPIPEVHRMFEMHRLEEISDLEHYTMLLSQVPAWVRQIHGLMEEQFRKGILLPKDEIAIVIPFIKSFSAEGEHNPFYVESDRLKDVPDLDATEFQQRTLAIIDNGIVPAFAGLGEFLAGEYLQKAPEGVGLRQYPNGEAYYRYLVRYHTTLDVTPEEVHQIGLKKVEELDAEMKGIRDSLKFEGTREEFHAFLKTDRRFIPDSAEKIRETFLSFDQRIQPHLDDYFLRKPKAPYDVKRLDPDLEGSMTFGYYDEPSKENPEGIYYFNGSKLSERPLFNSGSIAYHELVPGHHFQIALQSENEALPEFRRNSYQTAFIEGWAEYASGLAREMGMFRDPYELYGRLAAEMFLTVRLVVDTGMNQLSWPRSRAIDYMKKHVLESATQINTETLRYSVDMPGQALGYKMGSIKIRELREKARKALGDRFDIRKFHDAVLGGGSMPLEVLEQQIDYFIEIQGANPSTD